MTCVYDFSRGNGTGVVEAIGNWGFSNRVTSSGNELQRVKNIFSQMDRLRGKKPTLCVKYDCRNDPEARHVKPSPHECKPAWTFPSKRPLITYSSTAEIMVRSNLTDCLPDLAYPMPGRSYYIQGSDKWYRRGPDCCPQPSCLATQCPRPYH
ncbi:uncharacterized protein LOC117180156 [Belonocnema kinseyi]|uniref:uncharacterized protein LOC117180156 n=1 Tax=Belonocnema kinseyi TaxID=2817044 RepID=UPI00143D0286|nr:uncharacterized protein LOC117180156 [Belonocnema kinseyi]